jgi:hypothetical protein
MISPGVDRKKAQQDCGLSESWSGGWHRVCRNYRRWHASSIQQRNLHALHEMPNEREKVVRTWGHEPQPKNIAASKIFQIEQQKLWPKPRNHGYGRSRNGVTVRGCVLSHS